ncbi:MAG: 6-pyruvoyltetrahydropterin synthase [Benniella sp.]|nr:MAG: 6-pyruvoyltetrahydropterin synthase [Benniella sp.]
MTTGPRRTAYVTRIEHFSAAHRLNSVHLSPEENLALFGKCNHTSGHGHNYKVEVTVKGQIDPQSGMVINITDLKKTLQTAVMEPCDHRNLDIDVPFFRSQPSTTENLAVFLWENIKEHLPPSTTYDLYEIKLYETDKNVVVYRGE